MRHIQISRVAASLALVLAAGAAHAQTLSNSAQAPTDPRKAIAEEAKLTARPALPPALPGARPDRAGVAPPSVGVSTMSPNEALFDAVNRGDVVAARDALSRGADIEARNVIGLTALDEAIDIGRNDLTFLLLSLRNANPGARMAKVASSANAKAVAAVVKPAPASARPAVAVAARAPTPTPVPSVTRYAGDPGTPAPAAGFLGFGGGITQ